MTTTPDPLTELLSGTEMEELLQAAEEARKYRELVSAMEFLDELPGGAPLDGVLPQDIIRCAKKRGWKPKP